jgi:hypothetical protein
MSSCRVRVLELLRSYCTRVALVCAFAVLVLASCASPTPELALVTPDRVAFETQVYPVLLRDCGFHACHGSTERFFQVFGPGHGRLNLASQPLDAVDVAEVELSYARARSMIDPENPARSPLLVKPLATAAGGVGHQGADSLGRNVYVSTLEPGYAALLAWVMSAPPPMHVSGGGP